jgi:hypothetical protein
MNCLVAIKFGKFFERNKTYYLLLNNPGRRTPSAFQDITGPDYMLDRINLIFPEDLVVEIKEFQVYLS